MIIKTGNRRKDNYDYDYRQLNPYRYNSLVPLKTEEKRMGGVLDCSQEGNDLDRTQAELATLLGFCEVQW